MIVYTQKHNIRCENLKPVDEEKGNIFSADHCFLLLFVFYNLLYNKEKHCDAPRMAQYECPL